MTEIVIQGELTDLNTYINNERRNRFLGAKIKKENTENIIWQTKNHKPIKNYPVMVNFHWYMPNKKKDPDNISFAKKFILDGLVANNILEDDGQKQIKGFSDNFYIDVSNPRIVIKII